MRLFGKNFLLYSAALSIFALASGCNSSVSNTLASLAGNISTDANGNLWATVSADMSVTDYSLDELNIPVIDPSNPLLQYGTIVVTPVVCSSASSCANGGLLTLSLNLTAVSKATPTSTQLPNNTAFPISFGSSATQLVAVPVGGNGAKVYAATGGGAYFVGAAIPFNGLNGAGKYTPGLDVFATELFDNNLISSYFGYFAGSTSNQTGIGLFADLSKLVAAAPESVRGSLEIAQPDQQTSYLKQTSNRSEQDQQVFFYHLWKLGHDQHPVLSYGSAK